MLRRPVLVVFCVLLLGSAGAALAALDPDLVAYWPYDEGAGTVANDLTGNGNDGTLEGGATWVAGQLDGAIQFNGSNADVHAPHIAFDNRSFTITMWVNPVLTASAIVFSQRESDSTNLNLHFRLGAPGSTDAPERAVRMGFYSNDLDTASGLIQDNTWYHLTFWYDFAAQNRKIYINGVQTAQASAGPYLGTSGETIVGSWDNGQFYTGIIDDVQVYHKALSDAEIQKSMLGLGDTSLASDPAPEDGAVDVPRDVVLSWTAGEFAASHDVYFGTSFTDVNNASPDNPMDVLAIEGQTDAAYDPEGLLEYGQTYHWRIDEANAPPDTTVFKGPVWSFTAEPFGYPIENLTATAASFQANAGPENTINGSGLDASDGHGTVPETMWMTTGLGENWIIYEFDKIYKLYELWVWNSNQGIETYLGFGARDVTIEYSSYGATWTELENVPEFAQAPGEPGYAANTIVDFGGVQARYVRLTINANWMGIAPQTGLSEVRFFYIPVQAREPQPADGATGVSIDTSLTWRQGREAVSHEVFFDTDRNAVAVGSALVDTVTERSYTPGRLDLGTMYYWKVNEVGDAGTYEGDLWSFTAQEYITIDDFESYSPDDFETGDAIWEVWIDGLTNMTGSIVGYFDAPYQEQTIVHGGNQSMPLDFNNVLSPFYSEAELPLSPAQDWTVQGADTLSLWLRGQPISFLETADGITMSAAGADIYNLTDEFRYAYKPLNGDGSITVRIDSVDNLNTWTKAGVMIRESLVPAVKSVHMIVSPTGQVEFQYRELAATNTTQPALPEDTVTLPCWVRLTRTGNDFLGEYSTDGTTWQTIDVAAGTSSTTLEMATSVYIGLAVTSHVAGESVVAEFSNVSTSAGISGPWQVADIGVDHPGNDPGDVYVAVQDTSNNVATVTYPGGANLTDWTEWRIPLTDLVGVNPTKVKTLYIGVGDRDNPTPGGAGRVFVDDIGYGRPADGE